VLGELSSALLEFILVEFILAEICETISYLQDIVQVKVNSVVYIINISSNGRESKQANDVTDAIAITI